MSDVIVMEWCNFEDYPVGGQLTSVKQVAKSLGHRVALVGMSTDSTPTGQWIKKNIDGKEHDFFAVGHRRTTTRKTLIPSRLTAYLQVKQHKRQILSLGVKNLYVESPELLMAVQNWGWNSICYKSPGLRNPLLISRYRWARILAEPFARRWVSALTKCDIILAAADDRAIDAFVSTSGRRLARNKIIKSPTRVDTSIFRPIDKMTAIDELGIDARDFLIVCCGRISEVKGWKLIVDSLGILLQNDTDAKLIFVGDGEDRQKLEHYVEECGLSRRVDITGFKSVSEVVTWTNAADVIAVASFHEGWCTTMLEAIACGKPIVSTDVSGARDMIVSGGNGYIVEKRDAACFADALRRAAMLKDATKVSLDVAERYALTGLSGHLGGLWSPLS